MICIFLFFVIFSFSFQTIPTAFFCDDYLKEIYVVEGNIPRQVADGSIVGGNWETPYYFYNLNVIEGDLIRFRCRNKKKPSLGGGCFFLYDKCHCYEFDNAIGWDNGYLPKTAIFGNTIIQLV